MRRTKMILAVAAMMVAMLMASAAPAMARVIVNDGVDGFFNDGIGCSGFGCTSVVGNGCFDGCNFVNNRGTTDVAQLALLTALGDDIDCVGCVDGRILDNGCRFRDCVAGTNAFFVPDNTVSSCWFWTGTRWLFVC